MTEPRTLRDVVVIELLSEAATELRFFHDRIACDHEGCSALRTLAKMDAAIEHLREVTSAGTEHTGSTLTSHFVFCDDPDCPDCREFRHNQAKAEGAEAFRRGVEHLTKSDDACLLCGGSEPHGHRWDGEKDTRYSNHNYGGPSDCCCGGGLAFVEGFEHTPDRCGSPAATSAVTEHTGPWGCCDGEGCGCACHKASVETEAQR